MDLGSSIFEVIRRSVEAEKKGASVDPDPLTREEQRQNAQNAEDAKAWSLVNALEDDRKQRKKFADWIFVLLCLWLVGVMFIILFQALSRCYLPCPVHGTFERMDFQLSDTVLIALITTTTINVGGFFLVVVRFLFRPHKITSQ